MMKLLRIFHRIECACHRPERESLVLLHNKEVNDSKFLSSMNGLEECCEVEFKQQLRGPGSISGIGENKKQKKKEPRANIRNNSLAKARSREGVAVKVICLRARCER